MTSDVLIPAPTPLPPLEAAETTLAQLAQALAEMPERRDVLNTERALTAWDTRQYGLNLTIGRLKNALRFVPERQRACAAIATWIDHCTAWRAEFQSRLDALPKGQLTREQDTERLSLAASLRNLDGGVEYWGGRAALGQALRDKIIEAYRPDWGTAPDVWELGFGSIPSAKERLKQAEQQLADAEQLLNTALAEASKLLA